MKMLPPTLYETYDLILERIRLNGSQSQVFVRRALQRVSFAVQPMTVDELLEALAIDIGDTAIDQGKMTSKGFLLKSCQSFIRLNGETGKSSLLTSPSRNISWQSIQSEHQPLPCLKWT